MSTSPLATFAATSSGEADTVKTSSVAVVPAAWAAIRGTIPTAVGPFSAATRTVGRWAAAGVPGVAAQPPRTAGRNRTRPSSARAAAGDRRGRTAPARVSVPESVRTSEV